jgi:cytochrome c oxidase subunit 2
MAKDQPVVFKIHSRDVLHAFWIPAFRTQLDAVPGITGTLRATPTRLGTYPIVCAELCGNGHALMRSAVHVLTPAAFQAWLAKQTPGPAPAYSFTPVGKAAPATPPAASSTLSPAAAAGQVVFTGVGGCGSCHTLAAAGTTGAIGPNLDTRLRSDCANPASVRVRGAGLQKCLLTAIIKPYAFIPSGFQAGIMPPNFGQTLSQTQIQGLVAYLSSVTK